MKQSIKLTILAVFQLFITPLFSQDNYQKYLKWTYKELDSVINIAHKASEFEKCVLYAQAAREKSKNQYGEQDSVFALYTNNLGIYYKQSGEYKKAEPLYLQSLSIRKKIMGEQNSDYALNLSDLGVLYKDMGNYHKAEQVYLQAMDILKKTVGEEHKFYAKILNNTAVLYKAMGYFDKAENLHLQAMEIRKKVLGEEHPDYIRSLSNLALLVLDRKDYDNAKTMLLQVVALRKKVLGEDHPDYARSLGSLAILYEEMGALDKAESLYLEAMAIRKKTLGEDHPDYSISLNNLAGFYKFIRKYDKAELLHLQALEIFKNVTGEQSQDYILTLNLLLELYEDKRDAEKAFQYAKAAIIANTTIQDSSFSDWASLDTFAYIDYSEINHTLDFLLHVLQYQYVKTQDQSKLELYYAIAQAAIRLNERIRNEFTSEGDKLLSLNINNGFVLSAISASLRLKPADYEETAFEFAEMDKGVLLLEAAKTADAQQFGDLPDALTQQENDLQKTQSSLMAKLLEKRPQTEKDSLRKELNKTNFEIDKFTKELKAKYPKYLALKYKNKIAKAKEIQTLLDGKTALVEYFISDSAVYIFYLDKNQVKLFPVYLSVRILEDKIKNFHRILSNYKAILNDETMAFNKYTESAYFFYETLLKPALEKAKGIENLLIITDGQLGHLPFETFLVEPAIQARNHGSHSQEQTYNSLHYLVKDYNISYHYSATLWKENKEVPKNKNNGQILGIAANYEFMTTNQAKVNALRLPYEQEIRKGFQPLPMARKEIEMLQSEFSGLFVFDDLASEQNFKTKAKDYAVIHLAMHGLLDSKNPILSSLAFTENGDGAENNFLQAYEISKMQLNADLVVLSACETGYGKFNKGNGIASLAQAFAYAGAPAMVVSLWQVNDASTEALMKFFYENLATGMPKDQALRKAKLSYIQSASGIAAHPAFWSPFIQIGNTDPVQLSGKSSGWIWAVVGGVLVLGIGGVMAMRRKE